MRERRDHLLIHLPALCLVVSCLALTGGVAQGGELSAPEVGCSAALQFETYFGGDDAVGGSGTYVDQYRQIAVREAAITLRGTLGEFVEYEFEAGSSRCPASGSGGPEVSVKEVAVLYGPVEQVRLGFMKGHIMRGFEMREECTGVLAAEKARFSPVLAPCHPVGAVCECNFDLGGEGGIETQFAYLNGAALTLEEEHDANLGIILHTPLRGLSVGGYYNDVRLDLGTIDPTTYESIYGDGFRAGIGVDYQGAHAVVRSEYYVGKAFRQAAGGSPVAEDPEDREMTAFYIQAGYTVATGIAAAPQLRPYVRYQHWDKASDDLGDHEYGYLTAGVAVALGGNHSLLRLDYETPTSPPTGTPEEADRLIVRLQAAL